MKKTIKMNWNDYDRRLPMIYKLFSVNYGYFFQFTEAEVPTKWLIFKLFKSDIKGSYHVNCMGKVERILLQPKAI